MSLMNKENIIVKPVIRHPKKITSIEDILMDVKADCPTAQIFKMRPNMVMQMLMHYYPKSTKKLMQKSIKKAQDEHRLEMDKAYCAKFVQNVQ